MTKLSERLRTAVADVSSCDVDASMTEAAALLDECERALVMMEKYATWQIDEGISHHPTLPSAVAKTRATLARLRGEPPAQGNAI